MSPQLIRQAMIKNPHHRLWDKPLKQWTDKDKETFDKLEEKPKPKWKAVNSKKVIRVKDGFEYSSISECRRQNGFYKIEMDNKLKQGIEFKIKPPK